MSHAIQVVGVAIGIQSTQLESKRREQPALGTHGGRSHDGFADRKHAYS
jgi:hypothetical protein